MLRVQQVVSSYHTSVHETQVRYLRAYNASLAPLAYLLSMATTLPLHPHILLITLHTRIQLKSRICSDVEIAVPFHSHYIRIRSHATKGHVVILSGKPYTKYSIGRV